MASNKVEFLNASGEKIAARLEMPVDQKPLAFAVFAHCFTCSKNLSAVRNISRALNRKGFAVLRFDFTGLGDSEGEFSDTNLSTNIADLVAATDFLTNRYRPPELLIGHSLGGTAVLLAARKVPSLKGVATIGAPSDPEHVTHLMGDGLSKLEEEGEADVDIGGRPFKIKKQFVDDLRRFDLTHELRELKLPLLVMHSPQDTTVDIENAANIYASAWHPKSFISLDGANHLLTNSQDSSYVGELIAAWAGRYVESLIKDKPKGISRIVGRIEGGEGYTTEIIAGDHSLLADEPKSVGGLNLGPTPYDLVASGLAACTAMTVKMYAQKKGWDLTKVVVQIDHDKRHADDCQNCENSTSLVDYFDKSLSFQGNLDADQRKRLTEIASRCPVHKTLLSEVKINTTTSN